MAITSPNATNPALIKNSTQGLPPAGNRITISAPTIIPFATAGINVEKNKFFIKQIAKQLIAVANVPKTMSTQPSGENRLAKKQPKIRPIE